LEQIKITCELKKDKKDGYWVLGVKRYHGEKFEIINPSESHLINIKKTCDIKQSKININTSDAPDIPVKTEDNSELEKFALDCWNLAVDLRNDLEEADRLMEGLASEDPGVVPEKEVVKPKKTRRGKKKE